MTLMDILKFSLEVLQGLGTIVLGLALWYIKNQNRRDSAQEKADVKIVDSIIEIKTHLAKLEGETLPNMKAELREQITDVEKDIIQLQSTAVTETQLNELGLSLRVQANDQHRLISVAIAELKEKMR